MGAGLAALGILLLFLQLGFFLDSSRAGQTHSLQPHRQHVNALPGILGGALLVSGVLFFFTGRIEDEADSKNAIK
jgi:amino acid transporter